MMLCTFSSQPPFVMEKWIVGLSDKQTVDCIVNYEVIKIHTKKPTRHIRNITYLCKHPLHTDVYFTNDRICSEVNVNMNVNISPFYWTKPESLFPLHFTWIV